MKVYKVVRYHFDFDYDVYLENLQDVVDGWAAGNVPGVVDTLITSFKVRKQDGWRRFWGGHHFVEAATFDCVVSGGLDA